MEKFMTAASKTIVLLGFLMFTFTYCEQADDPVNNPGNEPGHLEFNLGAGSLEDDLKSGASDDEQSDSSKYVGYQLLISVMDENGELVFDKEPIPIYKFWDGFISKKIELQEGSYTLTEFMVANSDGEVIYATPVEGSALDYLVAQPLPIDFEITANTLTGLNVEVIPVGDHTPEDFGYVKFVVHIVKPLTFYVAAYINNPTTMAPGAYVEAKLTVTDPKGKEYEFDLEASVNELVVKHHGGKFTFVVETDDHKEKFLFYYVEMKKSTMDDPLLLPLGIEGELIEMTFVANSDSTSDALITDLEPDDNFGGHPMFAASFVPVPNSTYERIRRSLMYVDLWDYLPKSATVKKVNITLTVTGDIFPMDSVSYTNYESPLYRGVLKQIVSEWEEDEVTWNNQPKTIEANQVFINYDPWIDCNMRTYDITSLFVPVDKVNCPNHGFMFMHCPESKVGGIEFGSSDCKTDGNLPVFTVLYSLPQ